MAIDLEIMESRAGFEGMRSFGIYNLDGDTLICCWAELGSTHRPKLFMAGRGRSCLGRLVFKRHNPWPDVTPTSKILA